MVERAIFFKFSRSPLTSSIRTWRPRRVAAHVRGYLLPDGVSVSRVPSLSCPKYMRVCEGGGFLSRVRLWVANLIQPFLESRQMMAWKDWSWIYLYHGENRITLCLPHQTYQWQRRCVFQKCLPQVDRPPQLVPFVRDSHGLQAFVREENAGRLFECVRIN